MKLSSKDMQCPNQAVNHRPLRGLDLQTASRPLIARYSAAEPLGRYMAHEDTGYVFRRQFVHSCGVHEPPPIKRITVRQFSSYA